MFQKQKLHSTVLEKSSGSELFLTEKTSITNSRFFCLILSQSRQYIFLGICPFHLEYVLATACGSFFSFFNFHKARSHVTFSLLIQVFI